MNPLLLIILDGWGYRKEIAGNAIAQANLPVFNQLWRQYPHTLLEASGEAVGLPKGQMGSSEVGHSIIGAGRNVPQISTSITKAIQNGSFFQNPALKQAFAYADKNKGKVHIMGLLSDGGVHSFWSHLNGLLQMAKKENFPPERIPVHAILDGRDVGPKTAKQWINRLLKDMASIGTGSLASLSGRYWSMDRDKRWERTSRSYHMLLLGEGRKATDPLEAVEASYVDGKTDEFVEPTILLNGGRMNLIEEGDAFIFFNFRADRARQIMRALTDVSFDGFPRAKTAKIYAVCMTQYDVDLNLPVAFPPETHSGGSYSLKILPEILEYLGLAQLHIAETEKYAHVTYFFNGGREKPFEREERIMIPSPKVATYDLEPGMSAAAITSHLLKKISSFPFALCNFANPDMVGHTGIVPAAIKAVETVDECLGKILAKAGETGHTVIVTADHGNAEQMINDQGEPHTAHTTNPVPFIIWTKSGRIGPLRQNKDCSLRDIAATVLELMDLTKSLPPMEGRSLLV